MAAIPEGRTVSVQEIVTKSGLPEDQARIVVRDLVYRGVLVAEGDRYRLR